MFKYLFLLYLLVVSLNANTHSREAHLYTNDIKELALIKKDAIYYGYGERLIHVFLDPLCPYSRKFLQTLTENELMLQKYRYAIYLYSIPRLKSTQSVAAVYESQTPLETLLEIMLQDAKYKNLLSYVSQKKVEAIATVAKKLDVNKRPFLVVEE